MTVLITKVFPESKYQKGQIHHQYGSRSLYACGIFEQERSPCQTSCYYFVGHDKARKPNGINNNGKSDVEIIFDVERFQILNGIILFIHNASFYYCFFAGTKVRFFLW